MAYKQKGFPTHISTINRSPAQGWDWWDDNVQDQGYGGSALSGAAMGAQIGSIVPGVGTVVGGVIGAAAGVGYQAFKNNQDKPEESTGPAHVSTEFDPNKKPVWSGNGDKTHWEQQVLNPWKEKKDMHDKKAMGWVDPKDKARWQATRDKNSFNTDLQANMSKGLNNPQMMAKVQEKLRLKEQGRYNPNPVKPVDQSKTHLTNWNEMLKKSSPATQLTPPNRGGRALESNALNPMSSTLSALNSSDSTNLAVKYNQFNNIAQNLEEGVQSDSPATQCPCPTNPSATTKTPRQQWDDGVQAQKQAKYDLRNRAKKAGISPRKLKAQEAWNDPKVKERYAAYLASKGSQGSNEPMYDASTARRKRIEAMSDPGPQYADEPVSKTMYKDANTGNWVEK